MTDPKKHTGGCHCGKVRYEVEIDLGAEMIECNCSICQKTGTRLAFVPDQAFRLVSGEDQLTDYLFNKQHIHHKFCKVCGIRSFAHGDGPGGGQMYAINVRCVDEVPFTDMKVKAFDGRSL